ncbi:MAG: hypothetical protein F4Y38_03915 [Gemmatimonadetes bacterium]|nr:hypothetical protein [Gemmatimonadota bacterium]MYG84703.1 hypothetical protein [Gemmatimonadota bacterium]MYJ88712.1 hypothetical protein [Gemmatimonadota bacterium]
MSGAAILYLRLLRRIVRESAWRLGGAEESFLATGFSASDTLASPRPVERDGRCTRSVVCGGSVEGDSNART